MDCLCTILALSISDSFIAFLWTQEKVPKLKKFQERIFDLLECEMDKDFPKRKEGKMV